jgi:hypothetical protein
MITVRRYRESANVVLIRFPLKTAMVVLLRLSEVNSHGFVDESRESSFDDWKK